jgi:protein ImuB
MYACLHIPGLQPAQRSVLIGCAASFSPLIEPAAEHVVVDIRGLQSIMGPPRDIAYKIAASLQTAGLTGSVGVAVNPHVAVAAARGFPGITVVAPGDEARAISRLPLSLLDPEEELAATLASWGIATFGDLSKLPEEGLAERLGQEGVRLHMLARGLCPAPLTPSQDAQVFESAMELDHGLDSLEPLAFVLGRLLHDVCGKLVSHGLAANELTLLLSLEDKTEYKRRVRMPFASVDTTMFLKLMQYDLAAHPPQAPIVGVRLCAEAAPQRRLQGGLFTPVAPESEKLELTLARLSAIVGEGNVGSPELLNTHRPDAFRMNRFVARQESRPRQAAVLEDSPPFAMRVFRPPLPAKVVAPYGTPQRVHAPGVSGTVVAYAGPWRSSGEWWRHDAWARDEWDVALHTGAIYRLHREEPDRWFVDGNYD